MDAVGFDVLRRAVASCGLASDTGRGLDVLLSRFLDALTDLPGLRHAAVVLADAEGRPTIRARLGVPDVGMVLTAALERGPGARTARVLRAGAAPVVAEADGKVAATREEAAMLAAPIPVAAGREEDGPQGWVFTDGLLGRDAPLGDDLRLLTLLAGILGRMADMAAMAAGRTLDMAREVAFLRSKVSLRHQHVFSSGTSQLLEALHGAVARAAVSKAPIVLRGEPGSGRGVLARLIHELSPRAVHPFAVVSAAGSDKLMERLFGCARPLGPAVKPAASGPGFLEEADGGTLLIRDAHRLPPDVCERLARFCAAGRMARLGGARERRVDTRLFFAAPPGGLNQELAAALSPEVIVVPSLRERREDIPALLDDLLARETSRGGRRLTLTPKALKALEAYDWPGNIREMEELVARLAVTAPEDRIDIADIPPEMLAEGDRPPVLPEDAAELRDMERQQVLNALTRHGWVQSRAARELGLTLRQIGYRIRKYGLTREEADV
ncbi:sigma54 specific transcriptional regulator, Fis family [Solidesulfovibrio fructosivorans JJ]]|uniref:Sigma54 specific transcriptional regulator, Fis family n=1 Tax=Solidesulfovibrio fructosivorans JJ] TaxID=596151 RepID=E1JYE9_SOLFR|nr:sigma 54-interacting transcriptional regulator [Solidesulfovibrio fructosivorans]EFL50628.1 sigma54 specific transcriptional regulator, Fis family [Solidesulfovibrio fructosivorans JJ]]